MKTKKILAFSLAMMLVIGSAAFLSAGYDFSEMNDLGDELVLNGTADIIVDASGGGDYTTIQEGINAAQAGDIVEVWAGTYNENVLIDKSGLTLRGADRDLSIVDGGGNGHVINITGGGVTVSTLTIRNSGADSFDSGVFMDNGECRVIDCVILSSSIGVNINEALEGCEILDSFISDTDIGIYSQADTSKTRILNNTVTGAVNFGMDLMGSGGNEIGNNTINDCGTGLRVRDGAHTNTIYGNHISSCDTGIIILGSNSNDINNNTVSQNKYGMVISGSWASLIENNNITGNDMGLMLREGSEGNTVSGNTIVDSTGIGLNMDTVEENFVEFNTISGNGEGIVLVLGSVNNYIYHNNFIGNTVQARDDSGELQQWSQAYPLGGNHWSHHISPDTRQGENQNVMGADGIVDSAMNENNVEDTYPFTSPDGWRATVLNIRTGHEYTSINVAIRDAVEGDTLELGPRVYVETVWVDKQVHLRGTKTAIVDGGGRDGVGVITLKEPGSSVEGITIRNAGMFDWGVTIEEQDCLVEDNVFKDVNQGIYIYYTGNASILDNVLDGVRDAIKVTGSTDVRLEGNSMIGSLYGIWLDGATSVLVRDNVISSGDVAINLVDSSDVQVRNNTIDNCDVGILSTGSVGNTMEGNLVTGSGHGIQFLTGADGNQILANELQFNDAAITVDGAVGNEFRLNRVVQCETGFSISNSAGGLVLENEIHQCSWGVNLQNSSNWVFSNNTVNASHTYGILVESSFDCEIYHNIFLDSFAGRHAYDDSVNNAWDNGYPAGGNYWSGYSDEDQKRGEQQDQDGPDGIWDEPYSLHGGVATDRYPFTHVDFKMADIISPVADAGPNQSVDQGMTVTFDGTGSTDNVAVINWTWSFIYEGVEVNLYGENPPFTFHIPYDYVVTLNVKDAVGNWDTDTMAVAVNDVTDPVAHAGPDRTVDQGTLVTFDGSGSTDNVGVDNYTWTFTHNGTAITLYGVSPSFRFWEAGNHTVTLTVSDEAGNTGTDTMAVRVNPVVEDDDEPVDDDDDTIEPDDDEPDDDDEAETVEIVIGPVLDADGEPISGAAVTVTYNGTAYTGTTNATGHAVVNLPEDALGESITVDVTKPGYDPISYTTALGDDGTLAAQPTAMDEAPPVDDDDEEVAGTSDLTWIILIIVIAAVLGLVAFMMMGKGKAPAGAPEEAGPEDAEAMPGEAEPAPEEGVGPEVQEATGEAAPEELPPED